MWGRNSSCYAKSPLTEEAIAFAAPWTRSGLPYAVCVNLPLPEPLNARKGSASCSCEVPSRNRGVSIIEEPRLWLRVYTDCILIVRPLRSASL